MNDPFLSDMSQKMKDINRKRMQERLQDEAWWDQMNQDAIESMSEDDNEDNEEE